MRVLYLSAFLCTVLAAPILAMDVETRQETTSPTHVMQPSAIKLQTIKDQGELILNKIIKDNKDCFRTKSTDDKTQADYSYDFLRFLSNEMVNRTLTEPSFKEASQETVQVLKELAVTYVDKATSILNTSLNTLLNEYGVENIEKFEEKFPAWRRRVKYYGDSEFEYIFRYMHVVYNFLALHKENDAAQKVFNCWLKSCVFKSVFPVDGFGYLSCKDLLPMGTLQKESDENKRLLAKNFGTMLLAADEADRNIYIKDGGGISYMLRLLEMGEDKAAKAFFDKIKPIMQTFITAENTENKDTEADILSGAFKVVDALERDMKLQQRHTQDKEGVIKGLRSQTEKHITFVLTCCQEIGFNDHKIMNAFDFNLWSRYFGKSWSCDELFDNVNLSVNIPLEHLTDYIKHCIPAEKQFRWEWWVQNMKSAVKGDLRHIKMRLAHIKKCVGLPSEQRFSPAFLKEKVATQKTDNVNYVLCGERALLAAEEANDACTDRTAMDTALNQAKEILNLVNYNVWNDSIEDETYAALFNNLNKKEKEALRVHQEQVAQWSEEQMFDHLNNFAPKAAAPYATFLNPILDSILESEVKEENRCGKFEDCFSCKALKNATGLEAAIEWTGDESIDKKRRDGTLECLSSRQNKYHKASQEYYLDSKWSNGYKQQKKKEEVGHACIEMITAIEERFPACVENDPHNSGIRTINLSAVV